MKILFTIFFLTTFLIISFGQDTKTKKKKLDGQEGTATFYVLASNDSVKQGEYVVKAYTGNRLLLKGSYENNLKEGLWVEQYYGKEYKGPKAQGYYKQNLKIGNWTYFNYTGDTVQVYDWTNNKLIYFKGCGIDDKEYSIIENGITSNTKLDCPPTCISGQHYFLYEFSRDIGERADLFKKSGNGLYELKTKITITIDKNFTVSNVSFSTDEKDELKKIIEDYIKKYKWLPGLKNNNYVSTNFVFSVNLSSQF